MYFDTKTNFLPLSLGLKINFCIFTYSHLPSSGDSRYLIDGQSGFKKNVYIACAILYKRFISILYKFSNVGYFAFVEI